MSGRTPATLARLVIDPNLVCRTAWDVALLSFSVTLVGAFFAAHKILWGALAAGFFLTYAAQRIFITRLILQQRLRQPLKDVERGGWLVASIIYYALAATFTTWLTARLITDRNVFAPTLTGPVAIVFALSTFAALVVRLRQSNRPA